VIPSLLRHARGRVAAVAVLAVAGTLAVAGPASAHGSGHGAPGTDLGPNVIVLDPSMPQDLIQAKVDAIANQQVPSQFGDARYAILFKPGTYGSAANPLRFQVGYYTEVAGLGQDPGDVVINGAVQVFNQCFDDGCTALVNFWRSLENLTINVAGGEGCQTATEFWAVSQAAPMRRVAVNGNSSLMDYCSAGPQYASGGFISDSTFSGNVVNGSQQQFLVKNGTLNGWTNGVWNQVFSGVVGAPASSFGEPGAQPYTTLDTTPVTRERPYLYVDAKGRYRVFVPATQRDSRGASWADGHTPGRSIPLDEFYVAKPSDSWGRLNGALRSGRNLLFTPGVYRLDKTLTVTHPNAVVLGLGLATISPTRGNVAMQTLDVPGIDIAGLIFDAGEKNSPALLRLGTGLSTLDGKLRHPRLSSASNPTALQDVFFRVGGEHVGKVTQALVVNTNNTVLDDIWSWRADHGTGVGWTVNTARNGVVVNGNDVTATGLFVEHYQQYNVIWNGERGKTVFFQNELPYDAPNQAAWMNGSKPGYAAYKVADGVKTHEAWGLGAYIYTNVDPTLHASSGFEVPVRPGVTLHSVLTISLNHAGTIDHVVNDVGGAVTPDVQGPAFLVTFPSP
jgi:hypothetical protein